MSLFAMSCTPKWVDLVGHGSDHPCVCNSTHICRLHYDGNVCLPTMFIIIIYKHEFIEFNDVFDMFF